MAVYREQGIVLRTYKLGETDRILHLLTQGRGKVRAVAKGVRKPGSRFGGRLEPYTHVDLQLYEGRTLDVVNQAEIITSFTGVREDYALSACGAAMVEAADRVAQEDERSLQLFLLLLKGLRALDEHPPLPASVLDGYLFRLASVAGYHPYLGACADCGAAGRHAVFSIASGGTLCHSCAPADAQFLEGAVLDLLEAFAAGDLIGPATAESRTRRAAGAIVASFLTYHLGKPLASWELVPR